MTKLQAPYIGFTCDCGRNYNVSIVDFEFKDLVVFCPSCGLQEKLTIHEIADIVTSFEPMPEERLTVNSAY